MTSVIWLDPINRDAQFLKLISEIINEQMVNFNVSDFRVFATNRTQMELSKNLHCSPFFKDYKVLDSGRIKNANKLRLILDYYSGFKRVAEQLSSDTLVLYSSGMSFPEIEWLGLKQIRSKVKNMAIIVHNLKDKQNKIPFFSEQRSYNLLSSFDKLVFLSEYMRNQAVSSLNIKPDKTHVMLLPHFHPMLQNIEPDIDLISQIRLAANNRHIIAYISGVDFNHGIDKFYRVLQKLQAQDINIYGVVLGRLGIQSTLNEQIVKNCHLDPDQLLLKIGSYSYSELLAVLKTSDFVLSPHSDISQTQSASIALALGENVPVLASNVGANKEMIKPGINGLLFDINDLDSLVKEITLTYKNGEVMRNRFPINLSFNSHLDPYIAVGNMLNWIRH